MNISDSTQNSDTWANRDVSNSYIEPDATMQFPVDVYKRCPECNKLFIVVNFRELEKGSQQIPELCPQCLGKYAKQLKSPPKIEELDEY